MILAIIIILTFIIFMKIFTQLNKDAYIENERRFNKDFTTKVVKSMLNIYKQGGK